MTGTMLGSTRPRTTATLEPVRFSRTAGVAGLFAVAFGVVQAVSVGTTPGGFLVWAVVTSTLMIREND